MRATICSLLASVACPAGSKLLPVLNERIGSLDLVSEQTASLDLGDFFGMEKIDDQVVRFTTHFPDEGPPMVLDFALFSDRTPVTRTNFLKYVADGDYANSFIHRSVPGFVIQGGGFRINGNLIQGVPTDPPIINEFGISNTFGTVSMAKLGGNPNSATSQWFISLGENSDNLDNQNGGFSVFAKVTRGTLDNAMTFGNPAFFPVYNKSMYDNALNQMPLERRHDPEAGIMVGELILFTDVSLAPLPEGEAGESAVLTYSVLSNSHPSVAAAAVGEGGTLDLTTFGQTGQATLVVQAEDGVGNTVKETFKVVVKSRETYQAWRERLFSGEDAADEGVSGPLADPDGDGLSNLQLFVHGFPPGAAENPVRFVDHREGAGRRPRFVFPVRNDIAGVSHAIEKSSDLGISDPWTAVDWEEVSRERNGNVDTLTLQDAAEVAEFPVFYRIRFMLE